MKKLAKKLVLNKKIISNLNDLKGGESVNTVKCGSMVCVPMPNETKIIMRGVCAVQTIDFPCDESNANCNTDFTCSPSNWGQSCLTVCYGCED